MDQDKKGHFWVVENHLGNKGAKGRKWTSLLRGFITFERERLPDDFLIDTLKLNSRPILCNEFLKLPQK